MKRMSEDQFMADLAAGKYRVVDATTHPFYLGGDTETCCRCGEHVAADERQTWDSVVYVYAKATGIKLSLGILNECATCTKLPIEERSVDAEFKIEHAA